MSQRNLAASGNWKIQGNEFDLEPREKNAALPYLDVSPVWSMSDFYLQNSKIMC